MSLTKMLKLVAEKAQEIARTGTEVSPVFVFEDANEQGALIMTPWRNDQERAIALTMLRILFKQSSTVRYVTASEAWLSVQDNGEPRCQPKDDPQRTSVLMVVGVEKGCKPVFEVYDIKDLNDSQKRTLIRRDNDYTGIGGALTELLDDDEPKGRMQ